jgi:diacylglycerol O-acyltransferase / wax synthase
MPQQHLDRLTAIDASFLAQEHASSHMHVGALAVFEGPAPAYEDLLDHIRSRLHLVPRYRQKLAFPPIEMGMPLWIDDPSFNLEYHIRHTALPDPGSEEQLMLLTARIFSQRLDRSKPLWELWLVEGLEGSRFALISKTHHSMVDGVSGVDLATVLFDLSPVPQPVEHEGDAWVPHSEPSGAELVAAGVRGILRSGFKLVGGAIDSLRHPERTLGSAREAAEGIGEIVWAGLNPAPKSPLNTEIGPHRRFLGVRARLDDYKLVKNTLGGTVNDVVLTVVSGALRRFLHARGVRTEGLELRALVPVSIRPRGAEAELGNQIAAMRGPLPVYIADPVARLRTVSQAMDGLKESKQAVGAEVLASVQNFAPPTVMAQASRLNFSTRLFNLIVTNVPGPQFPLYILGREMLDIFPVAFLPEQHALAIAIMSYNGGLNFGLLADFDALPDVGEIARGLEESLDELVQRAKEQSGTAERTARAGRASARNGARSGAEQAPERA